MKKILSTLFMALTAVVMMAQEPVITFEKTEHDFGKINEADGRVSTVFTFKNEGMSPLILSNVKASCGCTTPTYTKEPVEPGQTGSITVTYNPNGRPGRFQKTITITSNASEPTKRVYIKGEVIPKPAVPTPNTYPVQMGALNLKKKDVNFGSIRKGESRTGDIEYANLSETEHTVGLATNSSDVFMEHYVSLETIKPQESGKLNFKIDTKKVKNYGPLEAYAYVVVDGKKVLSDEYKVVVKTEVLPDFSQMTNEEKQTAPILNAPKRIDFGVVEAGKKYKKSVTLENNNSDVLYIYRLYSQNPGILDFSAPSKIKGGKKAQLNVVLNTIQDKKPMPAGRYSRQMTMYTNDPQRSKVTVIISWTIE